MRGAGLGLLDASAMLIEAGRHAAPRYRLSSRLAAATVLARYGTAEQCQHPPGDPCSRGVLTAAITDAHGQLPKNRYGGHPERKRLSPERRPRAGPRRAMVADAFLTPAKPTAGQRFSLLKQSMTA